MTPVPAQGGSREIDPDAVLATRRLSRRPLLLLLDIDGTLAPIAPHPSLARVPGDTRRAVASLAAQPGVEVVLVSGRSAHDAHRLVGVDGVWTIGNHGAELMTPDGDMTVSDAVSRYAGAMDQVAGSLLAVIGSLRGVTLENKRWTLSVHYREADESIVPELRLAVQRTAAQSGLQVREGKKVLEVRPPIGVDKGSAVVRLTRDMMGATAADVSILYLGDDTTDEDAFRLLRAHFPNAVTIHVGDDSNTAAEFRFRTLDHVRRLLEQLEREDTRSDAI